MLQSSTVQAVFMLQISFEAAVVIGVASFINMLILAYLIRSKITHVYSAVEDKIVKSLTSGLGNVLDDVGSKIVKSGVAEVAAMYPRMKEDMLTELGSLAGESINAVFTKFKMSAMGALGGAVKHDQALVSELGSILKEEIMPAIAGASNNPLLSFILGNERIQSFIESNPDALPLIQQHLLPFISKFAGGNSPPQGGLRPDASTFGRPL